MELLREFKPALVFLGKFLAIYFVGNILYGLYIESYPDSPDPVTRVVTDHTAGVLRAAGYDAVYEDAAGAAKVALKESGDVVLNVFEGCNGINVMIVFVAFLFAFGGPAKAMSILLLLGLAIIHLFNMLRIGLLYVLASNNSTQFYYYHKYFFTAILYLVVFGLWALWVIRFNDKRTNKATA